MKFIYLTSSPENLGGIAVVADQLTFDIIKNNGTILYNGYGQRSYTLDYFKFLLALFRTDLVVINTPLLRRALSRDLVFLTSAWLFRKRIHLCFHGGDSELSASFLDRLLVGVYKSLCDKYLYLGKSLIPSKDRVGKSGTFINPVISNPESVNYCYSVSEVKFLFIARLISEKGVLIAEKILKRVADLLPNRKILYFIAGSGPLSCDISSYETDNFALQFLGRIEGETKLKYLAASDFLILPSVFPEGMPMSILEAAVSKTVVLTTDVGAISDYLDSGVSGFLFNGQTIDVDIWANKIVEVLQNEKETELVRDRAYHEFTRITNQDVINSFL